MNFYLAVLFGIAAATILTWLLFDDDKPLKPPRRQWP